MYPIRGGEEGQERGRADGVDFGENDRQGDDDHEQCEQEDDRQEDDDHEVRCGKYEKAPVRIAKDPQQPTEQDIKEHNVTHLPQRSWCPVCVKARGREDMHRKVLDKGDKPTVSMDYKAFGESEHDDDKIQMVVVKDESTGCVSAHVCEGKRCRRQTGCRQDL